MDILNTKGRVLSVVCENPNVTGREIAIRCNVTERTVDVALRGLVSDGLVSIERSGRRTIKTPRADVIKVMRLVTL